MERNVANLVDQIYNEGLEKARQDADQILKEAQRKADQLLNAARNEEQQILQKARADAGILHENTLAELQQSSIQTLTELRTQIQNLLQNNLIKNFSTETLLDESFMKDLILNLASNWNKSSTTESMLLLLPESMQAEFQSRLANSLKASLPELEIKTSSGLQSGFQLQAGNYRLDFSEEALREFFMSFIKPATRNLLFGKESD